MKKYFVFFAASVAAVTISCTKEEMSFSDGQGTLRTFVATIGDEVKTTLDVSSGKTAWAEGDAVKIIWKENKEQKTAVSQTLTAEEAAAKPVKFKAECSPTGDTFAVYPSSVSADWTGYLETAVPAVQNGIFSDVQVLAAKFIDNKFSFQNVCGFLQFSVPAGVTRVVWSSDGVTPVAGKVNVGFPEGNISLNGIVSGTGKNEITVNVNAAGTYYLAVVPGTYSSLYVAMYNGDTLVGEKQTFKEVKVARTQVKKMGTIPESFLTDKYFVKVDGAGLKDGSSWDNAADMAGLRTFITTAGVNGKKIYMAAGKYVWTGDLTLAIAESFSIYGGYPADASGAGLNGRDVKANETIFDGDGKHRIFVVTYSSVTFDGLVFQNAYKKSTDAGTALIFQTTDSPNQWVNNCIFRNNHHAGGGPGGAMRVAATGATVTVTNSIFENNVVDKNDGNAGDAGAVGISAGTYISKNNIYRNNVSKAEGTDAGGGAIRISGSVTCIFDGDLFEGNKAPSASASAIYCKSEAYVVKCNNTTFFGNRASHRGCIRCTGSSGKLYLNACTFARDTVSTYASALQLNRPAAIHNCVFYQNNNSSATGASNIYHDADLLFSNSSMRLGGKSSTGISHQGGVNSIIVNSIMYNNGSDATGNAGSVIDMAKSEKTFTSYGHNIIGTFNATAESPIITNTSDFKTESAEHKDYLYVCKKDGEGNKSWNLDPQWVGAPYYLLKWTEWPAPGKPETYSQTKADRVETAIDAFDTATSMGVKTWLNEIGALNTDRRGTPRSSTDVIWPGSYDNSATSAL